LEFSSAGKSISEILLAVVAWFASLLSITLFKFGVGYGKEVSMEISMETIMTLTGVIECTVL
jgi:hypothetical protein